MENKINGQPNQIVQLPKHVADDPFIQEWRLSLKGKICPLVVANEVYYFEGLARKLFCSRYLICKMLKYGVLKIDQRSSEAGRKKYAYCTTESIAHLISWAFNAPPEVIIFSEEKISEQAFLSLPYEKRLKILFNAYSGCIWLDNFLAVQKEVSRNSIAIKIEREKKINRQDLEDLFIVSCQKIRKLGRKGFLPIRPDADNILHYFEINAGDLAVLIASIHGLDVRDVLTEKDNVYFEQITDIFIKKKLQPYLLKHQIKLCAKYSPAHVSKITGKPYRTVATGCSKKSIRHVERESGRFYLLGIDLAIYVLKHTQKTRFLPPEIREVFGVENLNFRKIGIRSTGETRYYSKNIVFAAYDQIAGIARRKMLAKPVVPKEFKIHGETFILTAAGERSYCNTYGLTQFDHDCLEHLKKEMRNGKRQNEKEIATKDLLITITGNKITKVKFK